MDKKLTDWSPIQDPDSTSMYTHTTLETPLGQLKIEWKGWKIDPSYDLYLDGQLLDGYPLSLDEAKESALEYLRTLNASLTEFLSDK